MFPLLTFWKSAGGVDNSFKMTVSMSAFETMVIPATGTNNFTIDWGDGTSPEVVTTSSPSHEYVDADDYQISITGTMTAFSFNNGGNKLNVSFIQFGTTGLVNVVGFAYGCVNLTSVNTLGFDATGVTSIRRMFLNCIMLTTLDVSEWDVSIVTDIRETFTQCIELTILDVSGWNVGNVNDAQSAFNGCNTLTILDVSNWNTSNFNSSIDSMFRNCLGVITLDTNSWDTRNIPRVSNTFRGCIALTSSFDQYRWWNRTDDLTPGGTPDPIGIFANCFTGSTNISNYASIPNNWKGL